jgi:hypothetical protein
MTSLKNPPLLGTLVASTLLSTVAFTTPSQAATFSSVQTQIRFDQFSHPALTTVTSTSTDTLAISQGGEVLALGEAEAFFSSGLQPKTSTVAANNILSAAAGTGRNYLGVAESEASILGDFALGANETFSFNFNGFLALSTAIDNPSTESAFALGFLGFSVLGPTHQVYDDFGLLATLGTPGSQDILDTNLFALLLAGNNSNIVINALAFERQIGGLDEFLSIGFSGTYRRTFSEPTLVSLVETKVGVAEVQQVPTPSLLLGFLAYGGFGGLAKLRSRLKAG